MVKRRISADGMLRDLERYVRSMNMRFSPAAHRVFEAVERNGEQFDKLPLIDSFLLALLETSGRFRSAVERSGGSPERGRKIVRDQVEEPVRGFSYDSTSWYTARTERERNVDDKLSILDLAIAVARASARRQVSETDVIEALLRHHEEVFPAAQNESWGDSRLHTKYNTLGHIARYDASLNVRFDTVFEYFGIASRPLTAPEMAPVALRGNVLRLMEDHPDYHRNCFVVMSFAKSPQHRRIFRALSEVLAELGFQPLRADQHRYSDDLLDNVLTYAHGCALAVAVHERIERDAHNANVAFEIGYLYALGKPVCLLKERTVEHLPSDLVGRLFVEFDINQLRLSIRSELTSWMAAANLV
jgi:hypothetical protein